MRTSRHRGSEMPWRRCRRPGTSLRTCKGMQRPTINAGADFVQRRRPWSTMGPPRGRSNVRETETYKPDKPGVLHGSRFKTGTGQGMRSVAANSPQFTGNPTNQIRPPDYGIMGSLITAQRSFADHCPRVGSWTYTLLAWDQFRRVGELVGGHGRGAAGCYRSSHHQPPAPTVFRLQEIEIRGA